MNTLHFRQRNPKYRQYHLNSLEDPGNGWHQYDGYVLEESPHILEPGVWVFGGYIEEVFDIHSFEWKLLSPEGKVLAHV